MTGSVATMVLSGVAQITLDALGALPASHAIASADTFSVKEVMEVLEAMGIDMMGTKADSSGAASIVTFLVQSRVDTVLRKSGADAQSWPASSAVALGQALVRFNATGVAVVAEFPLTVAFELLALDTSVWDAFLTESISVTAAGDDALSAGRRVVAARSEYVRRALLNKYLEEIGAGEATIAAGTGSLSTGQLHVRLMELAPKEQALTATSASMHMAHGGVLSVNLMQPDLSGSEHERRERIRLRFDADAVQSDASLVVSLNQLDLLTSSETASALHAAVGKLTSTSLERLITTGADIEKALAGMEPGFVLKVARVRNAIERRIERAICRTDEASERVIKAMRCVRVGDLSQLKLLNLVDLDDSGTDADPLAGFRSLSAGNATRVLGSVTERMTRVILIDTPEHAPAAHDFIGELRDSITTAIADGVSWSDASTYYRAMVRKASQSARLYALGERSVRGATFDISYIETPSKASKAFEDARTDARVAAAACKALSRHRVLHIGEVPKRKLDELLSESVSSGSAIEEVETSAEEQSRLMRASEYAGIKKKHPPIGGKQPCFFHFAKGSCLKGGDCNYHHGN